MPPVTIAPDGLSFSAGLAAQWNVERSGTFWFYLTDEHGLSFGRDTRIELQAQPDTAPVVAWEAPPDHSFVTPRAIVPIKALVKDDLAIRGIQLRFLRPGGSEQEQIIELVTGPALPTAGQSGRMGDGDSRTIDYGWDLAQLGELNPGDVLAVRLTAEDYKPQLATTVARGGGSPLARKAFATNAPIAFSGAGNAHISSTRSLRPMPRRLIHGLLAPAATTYGLSNKLSKFNNASLMARWSRNTRRSTRRSRRLARWSSPPSIETWKAIRG